MRRALAAVLLLALAGCGEQARPRVAAPPAVTMTTLTGASPYAGCGRGDRSVQRGAEVEPYVAVSPSDPRRVVAAWQQDRRTAGGAVGIAVAGSTDGGVTWRPETLPGGAPCGAQGLTGASDPWPAIGPEGTAYLAELRFSAPGGRRPSRAAVVVHRAVPSVGGGPGAWSSPVDLSRARRFDDKPTITADPGRPNVAYVVWHRGPATLLSRTQDAGVTWSPARRVAAMARSVGQVIYPLPGGRLLMTALGIGRRFEFVAATSGDGGRTWGGRVVFGRPGGGDGEGSGAGPRVRTGDFPAVAVLRDGTVVALWARGARIVRAVSRDGGRTWSRARVVLRRRGEAFTLAAAAAPDGTIGLSWTERTGSGARASVLFASSHDGGRRWRTRRLVAPFDLRRAPRAGGARFLGDYSGLVPVPGGFGVLVAVAPPAARQGASDVVFIRVRSSA